MRKITAAKIVKKRSKSTFFLAYQQMGKTGVKRKLFYSIFKC